jgi:hypothetical protein
MEKEGAELARMKELKLLPDGTFKLADTSSNPSSLSLDSRTLSENVTARQRKEYQVHDRSRAQSPETSGMFPPIASPSTPSLNNKDRDDFETIKKSFDETSEFNPTTAVPGRSNPAISTEDTADAQAMQKVEGL